MSTFSLDWHLNRVQECFRSWDLCLLCESVWTVNKAQTGWLKQAEAYLFSQGHGGEKSEVKVSSRLELGEAFYLACRVRGYFLEILQSEASSHARHPLVLVRNCSQIMFCLCPWSFSILMVSDFIYFIIFNWSTGICNIVNYTFYGYSIPTPDQGAQRFIPATYIQPSLAPHYVISVPWDKLSSFNDFGHLLFL